MILSFAPSAESTPGDGARDERSERRGAGRYAVAALPGRAARERDARRAAGRLAGARSRDRDRHRRPRCRRRPAPVSASRRRSRSRCGSCSRSTGSRRQYVPLQGARRRLAVVGCAVVAARLGLPRAGASAGRVALAPLHWLLGIASLRAVRRRRAARGAAEPCRAPAAALADAGEVRAKAFRCCASSGSRIASSPRASRCCGAAILLGAWTAQPWRWDHKTVFSLLGVARLSPACSAAGRRSAGAARRRRAGSTSARCCCCWPTSARASCSRCCCTARRSPDTTMKLLLFLVAVARAALAVARQRAPRAPPARRRARPRPSRWWRARSAACICRRTTRCRDAAACSAAKPTAPRSSGRIRRDRAAALDGLDAAQLRPAPRPASRRCASRDGESWFGNFEGGTAELDVPEDPRIAAAPAPSGRSPKTRNGAVDARRRSDERDATTFERIYRVFIAAVRRSAWRWS